MTEQQVLVKLTSLCSTSEHCSFEMEEKMRKWEIDETMRASVMEYLIKERYVDDERYCRFFVKDKIRFNKWGRRKVEQALYQKRIPREISSIVLDEVPDEDYIEILRPLLKQKAKSVKAANEYEKNVKLIRFAMSRGFTFDIIKQCIDAEVDEFE